MILVWSSLGAMFNFEAGISLNKRSNLTRSLHITAVDQLTKRPVKMPDAETSVANIFTEVDDTAGLLPLWS